MLTALQILKLENYIHWSRATGKFKDGTRQKLIDAYQLVVTPENEKQLNALLDLVFEHGEYCGEFNESEC